MQSSCSDTLRDIETEVRNVEWQLRINNTALEKILHAHTEIQKELNDPDFELSEEERQSKEAKIELYMEYIIRFHQSIENKNSKLDQLKQRKEDLEKSIQHTERALDGVSYFDQLPASDVVASKRNIIPSIICRGTFKNTYDIPKLDHDGLTKKPSPETLAEARECLSFIHCFLMDYTAIAEKKADNFRGRTVDMLLMHALGNFFKSESNLLVDAAELRTYGATCGPCTPDSKADMVVYVQRGIE